ncbi:MAG: glycosyltransferase family 2 protein [Bryobacteraceae bacterium]|jgi:glycosyltransferase involved in cell wall biosynthesis
MALSPEISIIVPTYNRLSELQTAVASILAQTVSRPVELIVVDDNSGDGTWDWLSRCMSEHPAVTLIRAPRNGGPGSARNLALKVATGRYFIPIDSDFILIDGAIDRILAAIRDHGKYHLLFFPCLQSPGMRRLDSFRDSCEVNRESFLTNAVGELIPVTDLYYLRSRNLSYPALRGGGEGILWARMLEGGPALFLNSPIVLYRTDVKGRICTLDYQMNNPAALAEVSDALLELYAADGGRALRGVRRTKLRASGTYHLLAGNSSVGRRRLVSAAVYGDAMALATLAASLGGTRLFRWLFRYYRTRLRPAYL